MRGINKVILVGNATRDAEPRQTKTGTPVSNLRLATNRVFKGSDGSPREETQYHTVICFGRLAEITAKYVTKGKPLYVEGRLETRQFTDKQGRERELPHIVASEVQFLGSRPGPTNEPPSGEEPIPEDELSLNFGSTHEQACQRPIQE
jgi:single-strand DNA-binding protein